VHPGTVGVEDAADLDRNVGLPPVGKEHGLGAALALVVAGADAVGVHVSPVVLSLRMHLGVAVDFARGCLEDAGADALGKPQHVGRPVDAGLDGLHGIVLVVDGGSGAGEVVDLVHLHVERKCDVVAHELEAPVVQQILDVGPGGGEEVVHAEDFMPLLQKAFAQMGAEEA